MAGIINYSDSVNTPPTTLLSMETNSNRKTVTLHAYGDQAKAIHDLGAFGTFRVDGMAFTITERSVEGRTVIDLELGESA